MPDPPTARRNPTRQPGATGEGAALRWVRSHLPVVIGAAAVVVVLLIVVVVVSLSSSSGGAPTVAPGSIVGNGPLTTGYRLTGTVMGRSAASITVLISRVDSSAGEARNVVLRPGATIEFDRPAEGAAALARKGRQIKDASELKVGDTVTLVGEFTSVVVPPAPPHQGYSFIGVEAQSR